VIAWSVRGPQDEEEWDDDSDTGMCACDCDPLEDG
jgi:hypothetical protein